MDPIPLRRIRTGELTIQQQFRKVDAAQRIVTDLKNPGLRFGEKTKGGDQCRRIFSARRQIT
jgi:hypothetical protein